MTDTLDRAVARYAEAHHGVFSRELLRSIGAGRNHIEWRLETGRWVRLYDEVYAIAGTPRSSRTNLVAACFAGDGVASHRSAADLHGLPGGSPDLVEITCVRWRRNQEEGLVVHESKALDPDDCLVVDNIPVTSPELTLLMLGAVHAPVVVEMALDVALRRDLVTYESTRELLRRLGRRGRNGAGVLRTILDERVPEHAVPESPMETRLLRLLRDLGFPPPVPQFEVRVNGRFYGRLDAAYPEAKVGLEFQSLEHHTGGRAMIRDNERRDAFDSIGWRIIGVTIDDLRNRGMRIAPLLHEALQRRAPSVLAS